MLAAAWLVLLAVKLGLGYTLKLVAHAYMRHYEERQARARWVPGKRQLLDGLPMLMPAAGKVDLARDSDTGGLIYVVRRLRVMICIILAGQRRSCVVWKASHCAV